MTNVPTSIDATLDLLRAGGYVSDRALATVLFLSLTMGRPLFLEGEAGVGKTEIAKVLAGQLGRKLIRLQCYEGLDAASAVYEWNYAAQMIEIRAAEATGDADRETLVSDVFAERFLIRRPLLQALDPDPAGPPVLLIDELDRADEAFEAYLLEILADNQVTIPELGTIRAAAPPIVIVTTNRTREIHDALKRRCLYHWIDYPDFARELEIVRTRVPGAGERLSREVVAFVQRLRREGLFKNPGVAETLDWATALATLDRASLEPADGDRHARRPPQIPGRHRPDRSGARRPAARGGAGGSRGMSGGLADQVVRFARALRRAGIPVGPAAVVDALKAVEVAGVDRREDFYWALHAILVTRRDQHAVFDEVFRLFWRPPLRPGLPIVRDGEARRGGACAAAAAERRAAEAVFEALAEATCRGGRRSRSTRVSPCRKTRR